MNGEQISKTLSRDDCLRDRVRGIFARDQLMDSDLHPGAYIVNTDISEGPGIHWTGIWVSDDREIEFYDPLGKSPVYYKFDFLSGLNYWNNTRRLQSLKSAACAYHVLYWLYFRCRGIQAISIINSFGSNPYINDARVVQFIHSLYKCV